MVQVTGFIERTKKDGSTFIALEISGGLELVQSGNTGRFYATLRKTSIPCTFDETLAKTLIGTQMPGSIVRVTRPEKTLHFKKLILVLLYSGIS